MYLDHFGLDEPPFRITPHTEYFFDGADRGATLDALIYSLLHDQGIVKVSGEVGSGKTMLCRVLMERLPDDVEIVFLANPMVTRDEILYAIADELNLDCSGERLTVLMRALQDYLIDLHADGRRAVILIDEAHAMPEETLEQVRMLSNLETSRHKLMQIVLFGQPELDEALARPSMRQLRDRITNSFRMRPLAADEVASYLAFRMRAAGYRGPDVFTSGAVAKLTRAAGGLTRRINILADKALLAAFSDATHAVTGRQINAAIRDSEFAPIRKSRRPLVYVAAALVAGVLAGVGAHWAITLQDGRWSAGPDTSSAPPAAQVAAAPPAAAPASPEPLVPGPSAPGPAPTVAAIEAGSTPAPQPPAARPDPPAASPDPPAARAIEPPAPEQAPKKSDPSRVLLTRDQAWRMASYATAGNRLLAERIAVTRTRLEHEPDHHWTIELFVAENSDPARMERFLVRGRALVPLSDLYVIPFVAAKRYAIRVVYGAYPDRASAELAARSLPQKYQQAFQTQLLEFAELRRSM